MYKAWIRHPHQFPVNTKTCLKEFCFKNHGRFNETYAWSGSAAINVELEHYIPTDHIYRHFDEPVMTKLNRQQQHEWRAYKMARKNNLPATPGKELCFILDASSFSNNIWKTDAIRELFYNGRMIHVTFVFVSWNVSAVPKTLRANTDIIMSTRGTHGPNLKILYETYYGIFDQLDEFICTFEKITNAGEMLVMANNGGRVFRYRPNFHLCG